MRHWLQLATRNWSAKPLRTSATVLAVALGVATVVTVVSIYHSVEHAIGETIVDNWLGRSHFNIQTPLGHWGTVEASLADEIAALPNVAAVTVRFSVPMRVRQPAGTSIPEGAYRTEGSFVEIDVAGVDPRREYDFRTPRDVQGRLLAPGDERVAVVDRELADDLGLAVGDAIEIEPYRGEELATYEIVGTFAAKRVGMFQRPTVYLPLAEVNRLRRQSGVVSVIDAMVHDASPETLEATADKVRALIREHRWNYEVTTATAKLNQLTAAQQITRLILLLFSSIAMLTSFFIIVTTMSMGMAERVRLLGALRCLGLTRGQLATMVLAEILPLGLIGTAVGLPLGMGLTEFGVAFVPYVDTVVQDVFFGAWGLTLAAVGGVATTLAAAAIILFQVLRVSPLAATNPEARGDRLAIVVASAVLGAVLLGVHEWMVRDVAPLSWLHPLVLVAGMGSLYGGYVLLAPGLVLAASATIVRALAPLWGVRAKLARDQIGRAAWRSAGVCWMLMVGLSLIVFFAIRGESIAHAWDFPSKMPATYVWSLTPFDQSHVPEVRALPGVADATPINDLLCSVAPRRKSLLTLLKSQSYFVAGEANTFLEMTELEFMQGDAQDAARKLKQGGYLLLPTEAAHSFGYGLGDKVPVTLAGQTCEFEVAGVVRSPAMDIAVSYFQADTYMMIAAASAVLGTLDDLERCFGIRDMSMFLMNIELPPAEPPPAFFANKSPASSLDALADVLPQWLPRLPFETETMQPLTDELAAWSREQEFVASATLRRELRRYQAALRNTADHWSGRSPHERWTIFRENLILERVKNIIRRPDAQAGSLRRLKQDIDRDIRIATLVISSIPLVSLIVASIGVANLMMVNVASRSRQIAVLRAVGATKSQIARLVLIEAMVLGALGCIVGVLLGMHAAYSDGVLTERMIGFPIPWVAPWSRVVLAVSVTWLICMAAGIAPALRAARSNVIGALQAS